MVICDNSQKIGRFLEHCRMISPSEKNTAYKGAQSLRSTYALTLDKNRTKI